VVGVAIQAHPGLHRQHDLVAPTTGQRFPNDLLGLTAGIPVRGVDARDALLERPTHDADALLAILVAHRAQHHGAEGEVADADPGTAQGPVLHSGGPSIAVTGG